MNTWTENTFELVKIFFLSEWLALPTREFTSVMTGYREGKYELVIVEDC